MSYSSPFNRLCIYFFYDKDGKVDRYVLKMLNEMRLYCSKILVVSNGSLDENSRLLLSSASDELLERENVGFDVWAYKAGIEKIGWENIVKYDEVVFMNHTIMGPVFPFSEVFSAMDEKQDVDFWGLTVYNELPEVRIKKCRYGYIPKHLQSHFIAVRRKLLSSQEFMLYWQKMPKIHSYQDSIYYHESIFTKYFADMGYRWTVYADIDEGEHDFCPILYSPARLLRETRCPVFKRRSFFHNINDLQCWSLCTQAQELLNFLEEIGFDTGLIWENILRTSSLTDVQKCVGSFIVPKKKGKVQQEIRTALVMHLYYKEQVSYCRRMADSMPKSSDIYITTPLAENDEVIKEAFSDGNFNNVTVIRCENRGRDVSALLVAAADVINNYDLVCFAHDKKSHRGDKQIIGESFLLHCFDNILGNSEYVEAIIDEFQRHPHLGMLAPPPPYHSCYKQVIGDEWTCNFDQAQKLARSLGINVPMNSRELPTAPLGTMFWFRPQALKPLLDRKWKYEEFPAEPNLLDGTMLHAIERLYVFAAQSAGFYSMWCLRDCNVGRYLTMLNTMFRSEVQNRKYGKIRKMITLRTKEKVKNTVRKRVSPEGWRRLKKRFSFLIKNK